MSRHVPLVVVLLSVLYLLDETAAADPHPPTVFISVLVRNKAAILPHFLSQLYALTYPKGRIVLHLRSDHNEDKSLDILSAWLEQIVPRREYHDIVRDFEHCRQHDGTGTACRLEDEWGPVGWTEKRFRHVMGLREAALGLARFAWADFFWALDSDVLLSNADILQVGLGSLQASSFS
jgi:collagen beta-1,O-galactosyltransferase